MHQGNLELEVNGFSFDGLTWGERGEGPPVLCLHGFPQRATSWTGVAERLAAAGLYVVAMNQRGYSPGARPARVADYAMPHLVADAIAMIEAIGSPVHLVGHDWGGVVGWQVAARRADLLRTWTAVSTPNQRAVDQVLAADPAERERFAYIRTLRQEGVAEQALLGNGGAGLRGMYGTHVARERVEADVEFFRQPGVLTAALNWYRAMDPRYAADLGPVTVATAYVWGSADQAFGRPAAELTGLFVCAPYRFLPLDGASHWLPDEAPDTLAEVIAEQVSVG